MLKPEYNENGADISLGFDKYRDIPSMVCQQDGCWRLVKKEDYCPICKRCTLYGHCTCGRGTGR